MSSLRMIGIRPGDNCVDIRVKYYVVFALELSHSIEALGILTEVLFVLGNCTVAGWGSFSSIEKLSISSFKSVEVGRAIIAGPGLSVT